MNKLFYLLLVLVAFSCAKKNDTSALQETNPTIISETISPATFQEKILATENAIILDVRTPEELTGGYIEGATNIDFRAEDFKDKINTLDKEATYFVYCAGGGRSRNAADLMKELQFAKVYDLAGGFKGWTNEGLPSTKPQ